MRQLPGVAERLCAMFTRSNNVLLLSPSGVGGHQREDLSSSSSDTVRAGQRFIAALSHTGGQARKN